MAVYKVIQDIEAEDKLLGPLTLKGFIYALIAGTLAFINFKLLVTSSLGSFRWVMLVLFGLPMLLFGVLASPLGREQPTEVWLLSRIRFFLKPRNRLWNQSGISHLVTVTAPKIIKQDFTKGLSQSEFQSRLQALTMAMDSGGWAVKNVDVNLTTQPGYLTGDARDSDRLVSASNLPQAVPITDVHAADDILDEQNNPTAQKFAGLMEEKAAERKKEIADKLNDARSEAQKVPVDQLANHATENEEVLNDKSKQAESQFKAEQARPPAKKVTVRPPEPKSTSTASKDDRSIQKPEVTATDRAAKLELAQSGNDLSVASIAHLANRQPKVEQISPNEVVISLH